MAQPRHHFVEFVRNARNMLSSVTSPAFEKAFDNLENIGQVFNQLDQLVYVLDFRENKYLYLSENSLDVLGVDTETSMRLGPIGLMENYFHERDFQIIAGKVFDDGLNAIKQIRNYEMSRQRIAYNFRIRQKDGNYRMFINQFSHALEDDDRNPLVIMGTVTDITDIHSQNEIFCRIHSRNAKGNWEKIHERFYSLEEGVEDYQLTPKEYELIRFVHKGLSSKEIANLTQRSEETIKSQRKSILAKTGCQSMTEVVVLAMKNNWI